MSRERDKSLSLISLLTTTLSILLFIRQVSANDAAIMAQMAQSITSPPPGWTGPDFCKWPGVNCDTLNRVTSINLSTKYLGGTIPPDINQLSALRSLSLQRNHFTGPVPALTNMASLEEVLLDENSFDSIPPNFLSGLTRLQSFSLSNNSNLPPWTIPDTLRDSPSLTSFIATKSNVVGEIPDIFGSLPNFQVLRLSSNNMTGPLPSSLANSGIQILMLNNQASGFSGPLYILGSMRQLQFAWLHGNRFSGPIPDLSACMDLTELMLRDNFLTGLVPDSLTTLPKLRTVSLQNNKFQGPTPSFPNGVSVTLGTTNNFCLPNPGPCDPQVAALLEVASAMNYPSALADTWEGNDACQNWNFVTCERGGVTIVNFARQNWTGMISPAYASLTGLKSLFLNDNHLFATIPRSLTGLTQLQMLDISNNNISGKIPPFSSSVTIKTSGNVFIGQDVPITVPPGFPPVKGLPIDPKSPSTPIWLIVIPIVILVLILSGAGFIFYRRYVNKRDKYMWHGEKSGRKSNKQIFGSSNNFDHERDISKSPWSMSNSHRIESPVGVSDYHIHDGGNINIPIEVLREATGNFTENKILGKGGFGIVYEGKLRDGTTIAVKRMESSALSDKGLHEFRAEIEVLTKVRHRHLVALHGFCDNGSERLLVYEYMPQGCLGQHLFSWKDMRVPPLTWNQRITIALDVARGVEYLHGLAQTSFIHRDLKPSNILLGDDMRAKVSDFGLVRSAPDGNYSVETKLAGTFGYLAPEYAATGRVTTKVDVYAFGVVLMEIITGRKALDDSLPDEQCHLVTWFRRLITDKDAVRAALDPVLQALIDEEAFQSILKVAELAGHCTARESYQRPDMSHAVNVLSPFVEQWKPSASNEDDEDNLGLDKHLSLPQVLQKWKANEGLTTSTSMSSSFFKS